MKMLFIVFFDPKDLGCRYLSAHLEKMGHDTRILALKTQQAGTLKARPSEEEIMSQCRRVNSGKAAISFLQQSDISNKELILLTDFIAKWQPDVIGFGTRSINFKYLPRIIPAIRKGKPEALLLAGGFGPSLEPEIPLKMGVDAVIRGEGEYILAEMLKRIEKGENWQDIPGVAYVENGETIINKVYRIQKNLDNYPFPIVDDRKIFLIDKDQLHAGQNAAFGDSYGHATHFILSTRGCPAECSYCGGRTLRDKFKNDGVLIPRLRRRSLDNVLEELKLVKDNKKIHQIVFYDEFFIHPANEMKNFFKKYADEIKLPFHALLSPDQVANHPELLAEAVDAGLMYGAFGLQTGNESFCRSMYNRINNNSHILKSIQISRNLGLSGWLFMILGNPLEERRYYDDTLDFISQMPTFDPSFRTRYYFETNKLRIAYGSPPIIRQHPELLTLQTSCGDFYHDAMMLEFRLVLNDADFRRLRDDPIYKKYPHKLGALYHDTIKKLHEEYLFRELARLKGRKVNILGGGAAYERYKDSFKDIEISNFIIDPLYNPPARKDGVEVVAPGEPINQELPMLIMAGMDNINPLWRRANKIYPAAKDIVGCAYIN